MKRKLVVLLLFWGLVAQGQEDSADIKQFIRTQAEKLTANNMHGRGYVFDGRQIASTWLQERFKDLGLQPVQGSHTYTQPYYFPINIFPGKMKLVIDGKELKPGADFIIDARSPSFTAKSMKVKAVDMAAINDLVMLKKALNQFDGECAYLLSNTDSMCKALGVHMEEVAAALPEGCYIIPQASKLTWTVEGKNIQAAVFYVKAEALPVNCREISVDEKALLLPKSRNENLIAMLPGTVKDSFIAFTGHYDHLGMMGSEAIFPGASDNASGISMLLYLASYFAMHPQHYSILFIAFSGEEAGLLGSQYYVQHPTVPLANIKFLTNIDIMGDATDGVTVVNATEFPKQFALLQEINDTHKYIPVIKSRGKAHNSDHYFFTEAGVPSFFIYSNGGKGFYHDIFDTAGELTLNHVAGVAQLLIDATSRESAMGK